MSAPDVNIPKQSKNHKPALIAIAGSLSFAGLLFAAYLFLISGNGTPPEGAESQIDGRTGQIVVTE